MLVFPQIDPMNSHGFFSGRFDPRGTPAFNIEMRQQKLQEEEIPIQAMVALNISKITALGGTNLMISRLGEQIKTLTNQAENPVSQ